MLRISTVWLAALMALAIFGLHPALPAPARANWVSAEVEDLCPPVEDGGLVQAEAPEIYLLSQAALRWIPDLATLLALGLADTPVVRWSTVCLVMVPIGEPIPSVLAPELPRVSVAAPAAAVEPPSVRLVPSATATPSASDTQRLGPLAVSGVPTDSALTLSASTNELSVNGTLTLTAHLTEPDGGPYTLAIQRLRVGGGPSGGLVANCAGAPTCVGQTRGSQPAQVSYLATLYRCDARTVCVAERSSNTVTVQWR